MLFSERDLKVYEEALKEVFTARPRFHEKIKDGGRSPNLLFFSSPDKKRRGQENAICFKSKRSKKERGKRLKD